METAENGTQGIEKAKALKPALILMDVKMPGMDGAQTALTMRNEPDLKNIKIVFLTSLGDPNAEVQANDAKLAQGLGFQGYIKKTDDQLRESYFHVDFVGGSAVALDANQLPH